MKENISLFIGFAFFGALIGMITGLTSSPIASAIVTALFGFAGGTLLLNFVSKTPEEQIKIGIVLFAFSLFCSGGILSGVYIKVNQLLTNTPVHVKQAGSFKVTDSAQKPEIYLYLRSKEANLIELKFRNHEISKDSALQALFNLNQP